MLHCWHWGWQLISENLYFILLLLIKCQFCICSHGISAQQVTHLHIPFFDSLNLTYSLNTLSAKSFHVILHCGLQHFVQYSLRMCCHNSLFSSPSKAFFVFHSFLKHSNFGSLIFFVFMYLSLVNKGINYYYSKKICFQLSVIIVISILFSKIIVYHVFVSFIKVFNIFYIS